MSVWNLRLLSARCPTIQRSGLLSTTKRIRALFCVKVLSEERRTRRGMQTRSRECQHMANLGVLSHLFFFLFLLTAFLRSENEKWRQNEIP